MRRLSRQLANDEQVAVEAHLHWVKLLRPFVWLAIACGIGAAAVVFADGTPIPPEYVRIGAAVLAGLAGLRFAWAFLVWLRTGYFVTSYRLMGVSGVFRGRKWSVPLRNVTHVEQSRSFPGRLLGYGQVTFRAGENSYRLAPVARPRLLQRALVAPPDLGPAPIRAEPPTRRTMTTRPYTEAPPANNEAPVSAPSNGGLLAGRYRVQGRIAGGGMGTVFKASDERLGRPVAIKILKEELADDSSFVERFRREARAAAMLAHSNIAAIYDYGEEPDGHFIVMELLEGRDLSRLFVETQTIEPQRAAAITCQVLEALQHAHERGVIHRDVKPANIVLGPADRVKVTDFGIAQALGAARLTATGAFLGSAHYVAPERVKGDAAVPASDIYSVGVVLFEMLVGRAPFEGDSLHQVLERRLTEDVPAPSRSARGLPPVLDAIVLRATARDSGDRFASAAEMRDQLVSTLVEAIPPATATRDTLRLPEDTPPLPQIL
jgi:predicted Ser/Thr protein kinase